MFLHYLTGKYVPVKNAVLMLYKRHFWQCWCSLTFFLTTLSCCVFTAPSSSPRHTPTSTVSVCITNSQTCLSHIFRLKLCGCSCSCLHAFFKKCPFYTSLIFWHPYNIFCFFRTFYERFGCVSFISILLLKRAGSYAGPLNYLANLCLLEMFTVICFEWNYISCVFF